MVVGIFFSLGFLMPQQLVMLHSNFFFLPLCLCGRLCMKDAIFFPFCFFIRFVDFVICVITRFVVFIFIFLLDLWVLNLGCSFVVVDIFFSLGFLIRVVCFMLWSNLIYFVLWYGFFYIYIYFIA